MKPFKNVQIVCLLFLFYILAPGVSQGQAPSSKPLRLVVIGSSHGHVGWILNHKNKAEIELAGVYEPNQELVDRYVKNYKLSKDLFYNDLEKMLTTVKPTGAVAFGSIYEHMAAVEACAPKGIHVMVEKPLATNVAHAEKMLTLAKKHNIYLLTNYETSWYPVTEKSFQLINDSSFVGKVRKVVIHDGHEGPKEIGVSKEFLGWLSDPVQNGGGALVDFGCYGANLMTYLMKGKQPLSVTAVTRQFKPEIYSKVDDEATIIVSYPDAQCIIQASWNWPFGRKDMEIYGETGYIITENNNKMKVRNKANNKDRYMNLTPEETGVYVDPFLYFKQVIDGKIKTGPYGLYSMENNLVVVKILEAARESAKTGKTVVLK